VSKHEQLPKAIALALITSLLASVVAASCKYLSGYLSLHVIIFVQYTVCLVIVAPLLLRSGTASFKTQRPLLHLFRGLAGLGSFYAFYYAIINIPLIEASLLRNAAPLCVPLTLMLWLGIKIPRNRWLPLGIGFLGVTCILKPTPDYINLWHFIGFGSAILLSFSMVGTRLLVKTESNTCVLFYYFATAVLGSFPFALSSWQPAPFSIWLLLISSGVGLYVAMLFYTLAYRYGKPSIISPISYFGVVFSGVWGWLFWQQLPTIESYIGTSLVILGAVYVLLIGKEEILLEDNNVNK